MAMVTSSAELSKIESEIQRLLPGPAGGTCAPWLLAQNQQRLRLLLQSGPSSQIKDEAEKAWANGLGIK